jgi:hypothetical protein
MVEYVAKDSVSKLAFYLLMFCIFDFITRTNLVATLNPKLRFTRWMNESKTKKDFCSLPFGLNIW